MNLIKKLSFLAIFLSGFATIQSCQEPDVQSRKESGEVKLKGIPPIVPGNPTPLFSLYAIRNNTLYGIEHNTGVVKAIGPEGFWSGASAMTIVHLPCGNGQYIINIMKGNALYTVNPQIGTIQKVGSALILAKTRFLFGYYLTRILTTSNLFFNLGCSLSPRNISGTWTNIEAVATVSHVDDEDSPRIETNYFIQNGSLYSLQTNTAILADPENNWNGTKAMTSIGDQLYIAKLNALHRFDTKTGVSATISSANDDWSKTEALGSAAGSLYAIKAGTLYRIDPSNGNATQVGANGEWAGTVVLSNLPPRRVFP